jgi:uncharacterized protein (DUF697 family)/uncharacterized tellurite resistance protein B-like protein
MSDEVPNKLQQKVTDSLNDVFERTINDRKKHYVDHPSELPERKDIDAIINKWANTNALVAGAAGLVPGPWGMLAAVPEIAAVIGNQTKMIFDLGVAHGQHRYLRSELVIGILMSSMGSGGGSLLAVQGGKLLVRRASLRVMQKVVAMLGGKVTQQLLKSMVGKWLPVVGAAAMAAWARYSTKKLGEHACEMLSKEIVDGGEATDESEVATTETPRSPLTATITASTPTSVSDGASRIEIAKIRALTNVMLADQQAAPEEIAFIDGLIENSELSDSARQAMHQVVTAGKRTEVDYAAFSESPEDRAGLLFAMVALAKRDGNVHLAERLYIKQVAKQLGFAETDVASAFETEMPASSIPVAPVQIPWRVDAVVKDPEFNVDVDLTVSGHATILGVWDEALAWVAEQCGRIAVDALSRSTTTLALAWTQTGDLAASLQDQLDTLLRPHQMHAISVEGVDVQIAAHSMAALEKAGA